MAQLVIRFDVDDIIDSALVDPLDIAAVALVAMFGGTLSQYLGPLKESVAGSATPAPDDDDG